MAAIVAATGCGGDDGPYLLRCNVRDPGCQQAIFASLASLLAAEPENRPSIRVIAPEQLRAEIERGEAPFTLPTEGVEQRAFRAMGFSPDTEGDVYQLAIESIVRNTTAYYDSGVITIVERDYEPGDVQFTLAHELVHAVRDRELGLPDLTALPSSDQLSATRSIYEGDADYFAHRWYYEAEATPLTRSDWSYINGQRLDDLYLLAADLEKGFFEAVNRFPYVQGMYVITQLVQREAENKRRYLMTNPSTNTYDVLFSSVSELGRGRPTYEPTGVLPPDGYGLVFTDELGAWDLYVFLRRLQPAQDEGSSGWSSRQGYSVTRPNGDSFDISPAEDWRGDRLRVYQRDGEVVAVWHVRYRTRDYLDFYDDVLLDMVNDSSSAPPFSAARRTSEDEVAFVFAETRSSLDEWLSQPLIPPSFLASAAKKSAGSKRHAGPVCVKRR